MKKLVTLIVLVGLLTQIACKPDGKDQNTVSDSTLPNTDTSKIVTIKAFDESFKYFAFIIDNQYIVLSDSTINDWCTTVPNDYSQGNSAYYTSVPVKDDVLPDEYKIAKNMGFAVYSANGEQYIAKVTGYEIVSIQIPHFGAIQQWNGEQGEAAMSNEEIAKSLWENGKHYLVAKFTISDLQSSELCFAVPSQNTNVKVYDTISYNTNSIIAALGQTSEYVSKQGEYEEASGSNRNWWDEASSATIVSSIKNARNEVYTIISESAGEMCGGPFYFEATSIWCTRNGIPEIQKISGEKSYTLIAIIDINGDDVPEYVVDDGFGGRYLLTINDSDRIFKIPYNDCPC